MVRCFFACLLAATSLSCGLKGAALDAASASPSPVNASRAPLPTHVGLRPSVDVYHDVDLSERSKYQHGMTLDLQGWAPGERSAVRLRAPFGEEVLIEVLLQGAEGGYIAELPYATPGLYEGTWTAEVADSEGAIRRFPVAVPAAAGRRAADYRYSGSELGNDEGAREHLMNASFRLLEGEDDCEFLARTYEFLAEAVRDSTEANSENDVQCVPSERGWTCLATFRYDDARDPERSWLKVFRYTVNTSFQVEHLTCRVCPM